MAANIEELVTDFRVGTTINQFIAAMERRVPNATGALSVVLMEIAVACKLIASKIKRAGIADILGKVEAENSTGDVQAKLDVQSNYLMKQRLMSTKYVLAYISEEEEALTFADPESKTAKFVVATDPLDGSSNVDVNVGVGTIFGIWERKTERGTACDPDVDCLQRGRDMIASGYVLYGSSVVFVLTVGAGSGVHEFTLDPALGEFVLSREFMTYPDKFKHYSVNEGNYAKWDSGVKNFVDYCKAVDKETNRPISARYIGSFVADFHRNLIYGGLYMYPADSKNARGKLRVMYECAPLALLSEEAGGRATDGEVDILDIIPTGPHMRSPLYIGTTESVDLAGKFLSGEIEA
ncbi:fructose-1,6-bisphosphatase [Thecamonas trahens ATCC 50062]|uniref:fructose-bisphosphatase n=1 Tax=Thecamonas trahens ATCC 50062 TaxID=461836 RepID=A0A0L0D9T1_THETB|nr:fructose-1,6-bisphosphatase [Thecamonas trahens ATCC 50062]KNC49107.1 fructose-1,6-bisphosphatase [Thecamonas trahens ATCC 50062]|eukprot:XP_013758135.1 fructose-1,6-bisphosphatase [Thecamonas trahens ATCC 50062]